jgi:multidrug efflux pump subunit AcrB
MVKQGVLNFKEAPQMYLFEGDRIALMNNGITVASLAQVLRWVLYGPVVDKWMEEGKETDVRVRGLWDSAPTPAEMLNVSVPVKSTGEDPASFGMPLSALGKMVKTQDPGKIYRKDRRRAAYLTVDVAERNTEETLQELTAALSLVDLPPGYAFEIDRELSSLKGDFFRMYAALVLCGAAMLALLIILTESLIQSLLIILSIPLCLSLPIGLRWASGTPLSLGDMIGLIVLTGIVVNNLILLVHGDRDPRPEFRLRRRFLAILATSLTSIAGAIPLILSDSGSFSNSLGFFTFWGLLSSTVIACGLIPFALQHIKHIQKRGSK